MQDLQGQSVKGYDLWECIGEGSYSAVYKAYQAATGREVAIKIIRDEIANKPEFIRSFESETRLVARLEHPYIVPLIDFWRDPGGAYLVMRLLRGGNLHDAIQTSKFSLERILHMLDQISSALELAHRNQIIHGDIKPPNILLDEDGNAYLSDFRIVKTLNWQNEQDQPITGSPDYMSPEQVLKEEPSPLSDIFSLGIVLYEMLSGERPFYTGLSIEERIKILDKPLPELPVVDGRMDAINEVIKKATAHKPGDRYQDVLSLAADFREAAGLKPSHTLGSVIERLTLREHEVLQGIVDGLTNNEIADRLFLTVGTVKWYVNQIYKKIGVRNRVQARVRARELDLIVDRKDLKDEGDQSSGVIVIEPENPYKGLRPFQSSDHNQFFGRESLVQEIINHLTGENEEGANNRFLALVGPSGSGKSSVVQAGLIPALWSGEIPDLSDWFIINIKPGIEPLEELENGLIRIAAKQSEKIKDRLLRDVDGLTQAAEIVLPEGDSELLLVIDQFEELFTHEDDENVRSHYLNILTTAVTDVNSRVRVVITLRADFYDRPLAYQGFGQLVQKNLETIMPLTPEEMERAIIKPAAGQSVEFEEGLVSTIIDDISYQPGYLPLLQYALTELFDQRDGDLITHQAYKDLGGVVGAITRTTEAVYSELDRVRQNEVKQMFMRLVTLGEGVEDTRRRVDKQELIAIANDEEVMDEMIDVFAEYRLISLSHHPLNRRPTVELAHEALLREWDRLRGWLNDQREDIRSQRILNSATRQWENANQDESYLLTGSRLAHYKDWSQETDVALSQIERDFLDASLDEERRLQARQRLIRNAAITLVTIVLIVVSGLALWANTERGRAEDEKTRAEIAENEARDAEYEARRQASIGLAAQARLELEGGNQDVAILLLLEALEEYPYTSQAESGLAQAIEEYVPVKKYNFRPELISITETTAWSPDGSLVAFGLSNAETYSDALVLLDADSGEEIMTLSLQNRSCVPGEVAWSPVDDRLISSYKTGTFSTGECAESPVIWDAATGEKQIVILGHEGAVYSLDWSPDGSRILTAGEDGTVRIWDSDTGQESSNLPVHSAAVFDARWSPHGKYILTASLDGTAKVFAADSGDEVMTIVQDKVGITGADWSPDGFWITTANQEGLARIWDAESGELFLSLTGHDGPIEAVGYSPSGDMVATLSNADQTARIWDTASGNLLQTFPFSGGLAVARNVSWSPDGNWFTFDRERVIRNVSRKTLELTGHVNTVMGADWSPDSSLIITTSFDKTARLWDSATGEELFVLEHPDRVWYSDWSPDGSQIVTACADGAARIWDSTTGRLVVTMPLESKALFNSSWAPDGSKIINSGFGSKATIWNPINGEILATFGLDDGVAELLDPDEDFCNLFGPSWSPDSEKIVLGCIHSREKGTGPMILDGKTGELLTSLEDFGGGTSRTDWSLDGSLIASSHGSPDENVIRVWDAITGDMLQDFTGHSVFAYGLSISPDGKRVASGDMNGVVKIWDVESGAEVLSFQVNGPASSVFWSPDGNNVIIAGGSLSPVIRRVWPSTQDLIDHAHDCCATGELTAVEREQFGLPPLD